MFWYVVQLLVQLIIAFLLGLLVGWLLWARTLRKRTQLYARETRGLRSEIEGHEARALVDVPAVVPTPSVVDGRNAIALQKAEGELTSLRGQAEALTTDHNSLAAAHAKLTDAHAKLSATNAGLQADSASLTETHAMLRASNERLQAESDSLTDAHATLRAEHDALLDSVAATPVAAPEAVAVPDDLKRVEGIGPKMDGALRAVGIETFAQLAAAPLERLQAAIDAAKLRSPSVGTWATQAGFLADGDEAGFVAYIEHLVGGVEPDANGNR